ncbi:HU family DNA-binding protein [Mycoplasma leachii]|uniref:Putative histone-like DNA-binding protein n=1 Tax=Mycoplasma leachii 06049 TaxID=1188244 RepID=A0A2T4IAU3_9MOLU|nr:HU family DNA-binding protein [Mycoplasma leachii]PTD31826.1 putative histone-like DNA-binding protein [Mycoplasma leachii 06049]
MKISKKPSSKYLLVARILLGLFFVAFITIFVLKLINVNKTNGKIGADFMTVLTGFGVTLAKPVKWGAGLDEFCNIALITWIPLILIVSLIFYILYYKNLVKTIQVEDSTTKLDITIQTEGDVIVETETEKPDKKEEIMVAESEPIAESKTMFESKTILEPEPMDETKPIIESEPIAESKPVAEAKPIAEAKPVIETKSVMLPTPVEIKKTTEKSKPNKKRKKKKTYPQVTKGMLLEELYEDLEFVEMTKISIKTIFDKAFIVASKNLAAGDHIVLAKFGKFETIEKEAEMKINPLTQEQIEVPAHKIVKFKLSKSIKEKMNK